MNKAPSLYKLENLAKHFTANMCGTQTEINGKWVPARPLGLYSIANRVRLAWIVFTGKADVLIWPGGQ